MAHPLLDYLLWNSCVVHIGGSSSSKTMVCLLSASIFLAKPSSTSLKKLHRELLGAFSFSLVAQRRCATSDFSLLRFLSDNDSRFFFGTGVSSSPSLSVRPSLRPKGNRFRLLLSLSQLLPLVLAFSDIARSSRCWYIG